VIRNLVPLDDFKTYKKSSLKSMFARVNWSLTLSQLAIFLKVDWIVNLVFKGDCDRILPIRFYVDTEKLTVSL